MDKAKLQFGINSKPMLWFANVIKLNYSGLWWTETGIYAEIR